MALEERGRQPAGRGPRATDCACRNGVAFSRNSGVARCVFPSCPRRSRIRQEERRMWIVRLALRRPYTIAVMALLILVLGTLSLTRMIVDIFPDIDIPVVAVVWNYPGLSAEEMERRVVIISERGVSAPADVVSALQVSNVIVPAGTARVGSTEYNVALNSSPSAVAEFERIPLKVVNGAAVLLGDVARVSDSYAEQFNIVRVNGKRATYLAILKHADASTLAVIEATRRAIPAIQAVAPEGLDLKIDFDQSLFVRAAISGVVREAILASVLVSLMIFAFLGSWRSVVIVSTSIPLAIFSAFLGLKFANQTINIMTLGGLALAIGMLVDDATVAIENIHRNRALGKPLTVAVLDGAQQVAVPAIVATLAICIVFFPVALLQGPAKYLFTPLALAVVLAMLASYVLSRKLVPLLATLVMARVEL